MPDITYDVGRVSFIMKGAWNLATAYEKLDAVTNNGSLYIAKQDVPGGTAITNTTYWVLAVEKGDQGETGNGIASITKTGTAGNVDTYTITYTDGTTTTFTVTNGGVTTVNGRTGDVTGLAEEDGSYPLLNAGTADNLTPYSEDSGASQDIPFFAQGTGCGNGESVVDTGSYCQLKKKLGNTVGVNQQVYPLNSTAWRANNSTASFADGVASFTATARYGGIIPSVNQYRPSVVDGHKYLFIGSIQKTTSTAEVGFSINVGNVFYLNTIDGTGWQTLSAIYTASTTGLGQLTCQDNTISGWTENKAKDIWLIDLTLWYGSNDRIPSDLLSHPENWGRYYAGSLAHNAGTLESADGTVMRSIGRNVWDEEWELGNINSSGVKYADNSIIRTQNYIPIIPNTAYYCDIRENVAVYGYFYDGSLSFISGGTGIGRSSFTAPANARFMLFKVNSAYGTTYNHDITISLYYPGESGYDQYYPYQVLAEVDTGSEALYGDGTEENSDVKLPSGAITRKRQRDNLGDIAWTLRATGSVNKLYSGSLTKNYSGYNSASDMAGKVITAPIAYAGISNAALLIAAVDTSDVGLYTLYNYGEATNAVYLVLPTAADPTDDRYIEYTVATPTTEQGMAFAENIPCDDFGSMYWTQTKGIPQGNEIFYPVDYKASIDTLYNRVEGDMSKIVTEDEYPEAPSSDGTYVLKATVSGGTKTYAWVAE